MNVPEAKRDRFGFRDVWTWTALDSNSKLIVSWLVGPRDAGSAWTVMQDVSARIRTRVQMTTDGNRAYLNAVEDAFGADIDAATLQKMYGSAQENETRYSPARIIRSTTEVITGDPESQVHQHVLRGAPEPHDADAHAPIHAAHQCVLKEGRESSGGCGAALRVVQLRARPRTLRVTPAMEAGIADHVRSLAEIVGLLDVVEK